MPEESEAQKRQRAIGERREQVKSAPRPQQIHTDSQEIVQEVQKVRDTEDLWRACRKEWLIVHTTVDDPEEEKIQAFFQEKYAGRVAEDDVQVRTVGARKYLELRLWNVRGEFKHKSDAEEFVAGLGGETQVVGRNSREDHLLKDYGIKRLVVKKS